MGVESVGEGVCAHLPMCVEKVLGMISASLNARLCASFCVWFCVRFPGMFLFFGK